MKNSMKNRKLKEQIAGIQQTKQLNEMKIEKEYLSELSTVGNLFMHW